ELVAAGRSVAAAGDAVGPAGRAAGAEPPRAAAAQRVGHVAPAGEEQDLVLRDRQVAQRLLRAGGGVVEDRVPRVARGGGDRKEVVAEPLGHRVGGLLEQV